MQVVGECPGDKRKIENGSTSQADDDECTGDEKAVPTPTVPVSGHTLASDRELARIEAYVPPCTFENRKELLDIRGKQHRANPY